MQLLCILHWIKWTGLKGWTATPPFVQQQQKYTQVGRHLSPLWKSDLGQMIKNKKEKKTFVQYFLTKSWNTGFLANAVLCVRRVWVCVFCVPRPNWRHGFWRFESCSSGSKPHYCWVLILVHFVICHLPSLNILFNSSVVWIPLSPTKVNSSVAGRHTLLQPVKLSISMTASPASLTGLRSSSFTGWLCSGFLCLWSSLVSGLRRMEGKVQMSSGEGSCVVALVPPLPC